MSNLLDFIYVLALEMHEINTNWVNQPSLA